MSRIRYTKVVHEEQRAEIARMEEELATVTQKLRYQGAESSEAAPNKVKEHRRARLEQNRRHKIKHRGGAAGVDQK